MEEIRLQRYLAMCGVASRRSAEKLIIDGRVSVNGKVADALGIKVRPTDSISVDGITVKPESTKVYIMLNKPTGYVTTVKDEHADKTVMELVQGIKERVYPVGRLDKDTSGLLILTNDGDFAQMIAHPKQKLNKVYLAKVKGLVTPTEAKKLENGVEIDSKLTAPAKVEIIESSKDSSIVRITIHEGRKRQVRKMCLCIGHRVITLHREKIGKLSLGDLSIGKWRKLEPQEIKLLTERD